jgi:hypothetical protein
LGIIWSNDDDSGDMGGDDITKPDPTDAADSGLSNDGTADGPHHRRSCLT